TVSKPVVSTDRETYVIQSGETLSDIAEDFLGSPHKWRLIWEANKQRIPNPDRLKIGTTIVIP
ncbi:MAG: LysM peptidoglycan-binding domain-containing protein, partial [Phycisphaerales bacterium]|nr:LysM peptidoglycan-binding domain-containing protein [Phycisphaerales bacterium]